MAATTTVNVRIKNRIDTFSNWSADDVELLPGEIAFVELIAQQTDETGTETAMPVMLMKVGESNGNGGIKAFKDLPWLSAKAADVYDWAKTANAQDIPVQVDTSPGGPQPTIENKTLGEWLNTFSTFDQMQLTTVNNHASDIAELKLASIGSMHFIGATANSLEDGSTNGSVIIDNQNYNAIIGDIVISGEKEFIWIGTHWKELGDTSRINLLENKLNDLDYSESNYANNANQFVNKVTQTDGKINVSCARPTSTDILHSSSTVKDTLDDYSSRVAEIESKLVGVTNINSDIASAITAAFNDLVFSNPITDTNAEAIEFIDNISQINGAITATKKKIQTASDNNAGITKLGVAGGAAKYEDLSELKQLVTADLQPRLSAINSNYLRFDTNNNRLYIGANNTDEIIFDCGGYSENN